MLIRMFGVGVASYWRQGFNAFDGILVILGLVDLVFGGCMLRHCALLLSPSYMQLILCYVA